MARAGQAKKGRLKHRSRRESQQTYQSPGNQVDSLESELGALHPGNWLLAAFEWHSALNLLNYLNKNQRKDTVSRHD